MSKDKQYLIKMQIHGQRIAAASIAAYWSKDSREFLEQQADDSFKDLAIEMGYTITKVKVQR